MPRNFFPTSLALTFCLTPACALAQAPGDAAPASIVLPVKNVTLFSSGVSYTLRAGEVSGDATIPLMFRTTQINDILKSMVLLDEQGTVQPAVYASKDPVGRALQSLAVDVSQPTDRISLLNRLKGASVVVEAGGIVIGPSTMTEKRTLTGQIVGVDRDEVRTSSSFGGGYSGPATGYLLSVLGASGLESVSLSEVRSVRFTDERINREFKAGLGLFAAGSDDKRRQVTLHFAGTQTRRVYVGYVSEAPLWKISYRLLIGGAASTMERAMVPRANTKSSASEGTSTLQGWALVENTTDEDWNDIHLSLVAGRPISFIQDLYQPLYLPRPVVPPDVVASPFPQIAEANIEDAKNPKPAASGGKASGGFGGGGAGGFGGGSYGGSSGTLRDENRPTALKKDGVSNIISNDSDNSLLVEYTDITALNAARAAAANGSVSAQAAGQKAGELFAYNIAAPITLPRQQSAMIPVVAGVIDGEKVSLYNADLDARFPLNAFRIRNNTSLHLKGGPITIFDGGIYAGDARMEDITPGDSRLVTYAVDLAVQGERRPSPDVMTETAFVLQHGILTISRRSRHETTYTLKNKADRERLILVEHPLSAAQRLVQPANPDSRTASFYRFAVRVAAGATGKLTVVTEEPTPSTIALVDSDTKTLEVYLTRGDVPAPLKAALREVAARRRALGDLQTQAAAADDEIKSIGTDQDRIRRNMEALTDRSLPLYKRYVEELDAQETRIQTLRADATRLHAAAAAAKTALRAYLDALNVPG